MKINIKRLIALCVTLLLIIMNISPVSASSKATLTVSNVTAEAGEEVAVPIVLSGNTTGVLAMQLSLSYDSRLTFTSIEQGEALSTLDLTPIKDFSANPCTILLDGLDADTSNGTIIILKFLAPANTTGKFNINLSYNAGEIYDNDMNDIDIAIVNGSVEVTSSGSAEEPDVTKPTISVGTYTKTTNDIKFDVYVSSTNELTGTIIAVLYKNDGSMETVKLYPAKSTVNVTLDSADGKYIKVMWWNMSTLVPFTDAVKIDI